MTLYKIGHYPSDAFLPFLSFETQAYHITMQALVCRRTTITQRWLFVQALEALRAALLIISLLIIVTKISCNVSLVVVKGIPQQGRSKRIG